MKQDVNENTPLCNNSATKSDPTINYLCEILISSTLKPHNVHHIRGKA